MYTSFCRFLNNCFNSAKITISSLMVAFVNQLTSVEILLWLYLVVILSVFRLSLVIVIYAACLTSLIITTYHILRFLSFYLPSSPQILVIIVHHSYLFLFVIIIHHSYLFLFVIIVHHSYLFFGVLNISLIL